NRSPSTRCCTVEKSASARLAVRGGLAILPILGRSLPDLGRQRKRFKGEAYESEQLAVSSTWALYSVEVEGDRLCARSCVQRAPWQPRSAGRHGGRVRPATRYLKILKRRDRARSDRDRGSPSAAHRHDQGLRPLGDPWV